MTSTAVSRSDAELLIAHVGGDRDAFAELLARHQSRLSALAARRSRCPEDAADALQDALLAVHRCAASFRNQAAVSSWLHRIVANACIDQNRRASARTTLPVDDTVTAVPDRTSQVETAILVRRALMTLSDEQRAAVLTVDMYGHSVAEAARLLGIAEGTVKSRRARARAHLATVLGPLRD